MFCEICGEKAKNFTRIDYPFQNYNNDNIKEKFKIKFCKEENCKNKIIRATNFVHNISEYFNNEKTQNGNIGANGDSDSDDDDNVSAKKRKAEGGEESESKKSKKGETDDEINLRKFDIIFKELDAVSAIYMDTYTLRHLLLHSQFSKKDELKLLIWISIGPSIRFIFLYHQLMTKYKQFEKFATNPNPSYKFKLKIKTNIDIVDNDIYLKSMRKTLKTDEEDVLIRKPNLIKLKFETFSKLILFIEQFDYNYLETPDQTKHPKNVIYNSLISKRNTSNPFSSINTGPNYKFYAIEKVNYKQTTDDEDNVKIPLYFFLRESIEKKVIELHDFANDVDVIGEFEGIGEVKGFHFKKGRYKGKMLAKKFYIDKLIELISREYDVPIHFINAFNDNMKNGVDIFTIILTYVTKVNGKFKSFKFKRKDRNKYRKKTYNNDGTIKMKNVNFMDYIFYKLFDRFFRTLDNIYNFDGPETSMRLLKINKYGTFHALSERQLLYLNFKLSMIIPVFFGVLHLYYEDYKDNIEEFYKISKKLGKNLAYTILKIQNPTNNGSLSERGSYFIKNNLLNKYELFDVEKFINTVQYNLTNDKHIDKLISFETEQIQNYWEFNELMIAENKYHEFVKTKMEMWIFFFMTGSFQINANYSNILIKQRSNKLFKLDLEIPNTYDEIPNMLSMFDYSKRENMYTKSTKITTIDKIYARYDEEIMEELEEQKKNRKRMKQENERKQREKELESIVTKRKKDREDILREQEERRKEKQKTKIFLEPDSDSDIDSDSDEEDKPYPEYGTIMDVDNHYSV